MSKLSEKLSAPFPANEIEWRVGSTNGDKTKGLALAYLTARHVMDRLDDACGPENWSSSCVETPRGRVICTISIKIGDTWVGKSDGAGDSDVEAEKGAISDALKRAAVHWGIGRYLYALDNVWVEIEGAGKSYKIKKSEHAKLERSLGGPPAPKDAPPATETDTLARLPEKEAEALYERLCRAMANLGDTTKLEEFWLHPKTVPALDSLPDKWFALTRDYSEDRKKMVSAKQSPPSAKDSLDRLQQRQG